MVTTPNAALLECLLILWSRRKSYFMGSKFCVIG
jgi:hypothetical protein